jgi:hypothetical protein
MSAPPSAGLSLGKCATCHARFVPVDGPCPRCGAATTELYASPGVGTVLAATSLEVPPPGWERPHPLALVEVEDGVRLLAIPELPLPTPGTLVAVSADGPIYRARRTDATGERRGEGDAPEAGVTRPPFEPPR